MAEKNFEKKKQHELCQEAIMYMYANGTETLDEAYEKMGVDVELRIGVIEVIESLFPHKEKEELLIKFA